MPRTHVMADIDPEEPVRVRRLSPEGDNYLWVAFGDRIDLLGSPDEIVTALDTALTQAQALLDAQEGEDG